MSDDLEFSRWAAAWLAPAVYTGPEIPNLSERIANVITLWTAPIPGGWQRDPDQRLLDRAQRYLRGDAAAPEPGSEHKLELEILGPDPVTTVTTCFGARLIDGLNALPLVHDAGGHRRGNVEADMLLLTSDPAGLRTQLLVEAKTGSNNAWYGVIESLRQLRLFQLSQAARDIFNRRGSQDGTHLPAEAVLLAPEAFYISQGAKEHATDGARRLLAALAPVPNIKLHLATWDPTQRRIVPLGSQPPSLARELPSIMSTAGDSLRRDPE